MVCVGYGHLSCAALKLWRIIFPRARYRSHCRLQSLKAFLFFNIKFNIWKHTGSCMGFPGGSDGKESACNVGAWIQSLGQEDPLRRKWVPTPVFFPGEFHGQRSLAGYSPWITKSQT